MEFTKILEKVVLGKDLSESEAQEAMHEIMSGKVSEPQLAAFLIALRIKGETSDEIASFAHVMRNTCVPMPPGLHFEVVDTCGTGGDSIKTFNISTTVAFVLAGAGVHVAKHGNRAVTSKSGSADVLEALGVKLDLPPNRVRDCIEKVGVGFMFAPVFHPAMKYAINVRRELKLRTVFNVLGPLTNPYCAKRQLLGVYSPELVPKIGAALAKLGCEKGFVVHGEPGIDEVSTLGKTFVCEINDGKVSKKTLSPSDFGLKKAKPEDLLGGSVHENAKFLREVLEGKKGPRTDIVLANAALGLIVGGKAQDISSGMRFARASISSGAALETLSILIEESNRK